MTKEQKLQQAKEVCDRVNDTIDNIEERLEDPTLTDFEIEKYLRYLNFLSDGLSTTWKDTEDFYNHKLDEAMYIRVYNKLNEGGKRKHIPDSVREKFIRSVLIIPNADDRQSEIDSIFDEIKKKNMEAYFKEHPELVQKQNEE